MQTNQNRTTDIDERQIKPVVKLLLVAGTLFLMWGLISNLPGIDAIIPATGVTYGALVGALLTLGIVAVLAYVAVRIEPVLTQVIHGPGDAVAAVASIAKHAILFVAVITAHSGLAPLVTSALDAADLVWTYDLLFLALALLPTAVIGIRLVLHIDEFAGLIAAAVTSSEPAAGDSAESTPPRT